MIGKYKITVENEFLKFEFTIKRNITIVRGNSATGKTTLINYISTFFKDYSRLYLAHTNPAVNNLKRKVNASSKCNFTPQELQKDAFILSILAPHSGHLKLLYSIFKTSYFKTYSLFHFFLNNLD